VRCRNFILILLLPNYNLKYSIAAISMTFINNWEDFAKAAEHLYLSDPMKVSDNYRYKNRSCEY
jgi:hypothetical protein